MKLPFLHPISFQWAANHPCPCGGHMTQPRSIRSSLLQIHILSRERYMGNSGHSLIQWPSPSGCWAPWGCHGSFPGSDLSALPFCDLDSVLEKSYLLFVSQSLFLRHESRFLIKTINIPTAERQKSLLPAGAVLRNSVENWWGILDSGLARWILAVYTKYCID